MDRNIFFLYQLSRGIPPGSRRLTISTTLFGESLGMSQQTASRYLGELEGEGLIRRNGTEVTLTSKGFDALKEVYISLKDFVEEKEPAKKISGTVSKGLGEGAYYVKEYSEEIEKKLGFKPFLGTLNVRPVEEIQNNERLYAGTIKGFRKKGRTFGSIRYAKIKLAAKGKTELCYVILPTRTHHKETFEIISPRNLRDVLGLSDGDTVEIEFIK
jgi:riboflavin kinase